MRSKFSFWAYFVFFYSALFSCIFLAIIPCIIYFHLQPYILFAVVVLFLAFICVWLILGELRSKVVVAEIGFESLKFRRYLGLGTETTVYFNQLDGFKVSYLPTSTTVYEYLYLMSGEKKVFKLSQFYHKNYFELKQALSESLKNLGEEDFSYAREIKEIFV